MKTIHAFLQDESGPTAVEYAVMLGAIFCVITVGVAALGQKVLLYYVRSDGQM